MSLTAAEVDGAEIGSPNELVVGDSICLKLTDDGLIIPDATPTKHGSKADPWLSFSGCLPRSKPPALPVQLTIPYYHVLWATLEDEILSFDYASHTSKTVVQVATRGFPVPKSSAAAATLWIESLLTRAYGVSQQHKRIMVLVNPFGGQGKAEKQYARDVEPIFKAARCKIGVEVTTHHEHAMGIAEKLDVEAWDVVACCSGDGVPYEVFNGLSRQEEPRRSLASIAVVQLPCGTGNAMSWNLFGTDSPSLAALAIVKGFRMPLDLVSITQGNRRTFSFLSQSVGIIAECDLGTENMRWLGATRFTVGYIMRLLGKTVWPCDVAIGVESEDKEVMKREYQHYASSSSVSKEDTNLGSSSSETEDDESGLPKLKFGTINDALPADWIMAPYLNLGNFYAGNMTHMSGDASIFTVALPNDGLLDLMCIDGDIPILRALQLAEEGSKGTLLDQPEVKYRKVVGYRIIPHKKEGYISIDGERVPFEGFQAEIHKGLGCVLSKNGRIYEPRGSTS